jgi:hypothetical protein
LVPIGARTVDQWEWWTTRVNARSPETSTRAESLACISDRKDARGAEIILDAISNEPQREMVEQAALAAVRLHLPAAAEPVLKRASEQPDDVRRARLVLYAVQASGRDLRLLPWLNNAARSDEPWLSAGAACGLLELADPSGGVQLLRIAEQTTGELRGFAASALSRVATPLGWTLGQPFTIPVETSTATDWEETREEWLILATPETLHDVLSVLRPSPPDQRRHEINRLIHGRGRAAEYLQGRFGS